MTTDSELQHTIRSLVGSVEKQFGRGGIMTLAEEDKNNDIRVISTGSLALDHALGVGGYPRGRIVEIYGPESSGKTTLALHAMREVQRGGGVAAFLDAEHAFDVSYAKAIGIDTERLLVSQPHNDEQALDIAEMLTRSGAVDVIVINSVAAPVPKAELEGEMGDVHMGLQSRLMSQALRKLAAVADKTETTLIFLNQLRHKIGVVLDNPETTTGSNTLKFYASVRLDVRRIGLLKIGKAAVGARTRVKIVKNKCAVPFKEAEFDIRRGMGIDWAGDLLDVAVTLGVIEKRGAQFSFAGDSLGQGRERARASLLQGTLGAKVRCALETAYKNPPQKSLAE